MNILIYVYKRNFDAQKAERFFKERRVPFQTVDLKKHKLGARELALFAQKAGARALVDRSSQAALSHPVAHTDSESVILEYLAARPDFLVSPIVRNGNRVTLGADEGEWERWLAADGSEPPRRKK